MSLFRPFVKTSQKTQEIQDQNQEQEKQEKYLGENYIWVEGYKGTDENMCCQAGLYFYGEQYQLNEERICNGNPEICSNGFHFCLNLQEVFHYYPFDFKNRFFKVKAYVKESDYDNYEKYHKLAAKKIILTEEIDVRHEDVLERHITYTHGSGYTYILTEEEFNLAKKDFNTLHEYCRNKFITGMKETGYTESFANVLFHRYLKSDNDINNDIKFKIANMYYDLKRAKAYCEEEISKDMAVYLLSTV